MKKTKNNIFKIASLMTLFINHAQSIEQEFRQSVIESAWRQATQEGADIQAQTAMQSYYNFQEFDIKNKLDECLNNAKNLTSSEKEEFSKHRFALLNDVLKNEKKLIDLLFKKEKNLSHSFLKTLQSHNIIKTIYDPISFDNQKNWIDFERVSSLFISNLLAFHMNYNTFFCFESDIYLRNPKRTQGGIADYGLLFYSNFLKLCDLSLSASSDYSFIIERYNQIAQNSLIFSPTGLRVGKNLQNIEHALDQEFLNGGEERIDLMVSRLFVKMIRYLTEFDCSFKKSSNQNHIPDQNHYRIFLKESALSYPDTNAQKFFNKEKEEAKLLMTHLICRNAQTAKSANELLAKHQEVIDIQKKYYSLFKESIFKFLTENPGRSSTIESALDYNIHARWMEILSGEGTKAIETNKIHWCGNLTYKSATFFENPFEQELRVFYNNCWASRSEKESIAFLKKNLLLVPDGDHFGVGEHIPEFQEYKRAFSIKNPRRDQKPAIKSVSAYDRLYEISQIALKIIDENHDNNLGDHSAIVTCCLVDCLKCLLADEFQKDWQNQKEAFDLKEQKSKENLIKKNSEQQERALESKKLETEEGLENFLKEINALKSTVQGPSKKKENTKKKKKNKSQKVVKIQAQEKKANIKNSTKEEQKVAPKKKTQTQSKKQPSPTLSQTVNLKNEEKDTQEKKIALRIEQEKNQKINEEKKQKLEEEKKQKEEMRKNKLREKKALKKQQKMKNQVNIESDIVPGEITNNIVEKRIEDSCQPPVENPRVQKISVFARAERTLNQ